jgi:hypothetical protein
MARHYLFCFLALQISENIKPGHFCSIAASLGLHYHTTLGSKSKDFFTSATKNILQQITQEKQRLLDYLLRFPELNP